MRREDPRDAFVGKARSGAALQKFSDLRPGSRLGTSSLRRQAQLIRAVPEVNIVPHRGNITTRIEKLDASETLEGIVLACAGLLRIGVPRDRFEPLSIAAMMPAVNQGILVAQVLQSNAAVKEKISLISRPEVEQVFLAERSCIAALHADCHSSVCSYAELRDGRLHLSARVLSPDGVVALESNGEGDLKNATGIGVEVAQHLLSQGAEKVLEDSRVSKERACASS